jgi:tRNA (uracil-5-)-methyltransferase
MLSYDKQLELKRDVVVKAYKNYFGSCLPLRSNVTSHTSADAPPELLPPIGSTAPSPLQYGYRTKITPHFDAPPKKFVKVPDNAPLRPDGRPEFLNIGFNRIGTRHVMDIEAGSDIAIRIEETNNFQGVSYSNASHKRGVACRAGQDREVRRDFMSCAVLTLRCRNVWSYKKGVSLIFRESLPLPPAGDNGPVTAATSSEEEESLIAITDHRGTVRERVGQLLFEYPASSFFQNNNAVLTPLTDYVRDALVSTSSGGDAPTHLVDAYCGAGLFALALAPAFERVAGIELSSESIAAATRNAALNGITHVPDFPPARTALVIDPPRKGTDAGFLRQLARFRPARVVYVSCNVHTQARDLGALMRMMDTDGAGHTYAVESVRGFDLFPQTAHVESVAVLRLVGAARD